MEKYISDMRDVLAVILAGGPGSRLKPLTENRSKPSVPIGKRLIIDFVLSNCHNSGMSNMMVLTQYKAQELIRHIQRHWPTNSMYRSFIEIVPPQMMYGAQWFQGTADAVRQTLPLIEESGNFSDLAILSGDHVYMMDFREMYAVHKQKDSVFTICAMPIPASEARHFGIVEIDEDGRVIGFEEKPPRNPKEIPGQPGWCMTSLGIYFANREHLVSTLVDEAEHHQALNDFGKDIIPHMIRRGDPVYIYDFRENKVSGQEIPYWRDVGTIGSYYATCMDLVAMKPELNVYNKHWVIKTPKDDLPEAKMNSFKVMDGKCSQQFLVSGGSIIEESYLSRSLIGRGVKLYGAEIIESVILEKVKVREGAIIRRAIVDEGVIVPHGTEIGVDHKADRARGLYVDKDSGIVVVPKGFVF